MVVRFTTTCAISAYHHQSCKFEYCSWRGVLDTTLCDKVCQWPVTGRWFSPGTPLSSTNKTDRHDIIEILLKVALNTIKQTSCKKSRNHFRDWIYNQHKMFGQLTNKKFPYYPKMFLLLWMCTTLSTVFFPQDAHFIILWN